MKVTTKEIVVRMLAERLGQWVYGYELQGKHTKWGFSGVDADTRAHELSRVGFFDSPNNRYKIEHRRQGKYAQFRATKTPLQEDYQSHSKEAVRLFDQGKLVEA